MPWFAHELAGGMLEGAGVAVVRPRTKAVLRTALQKLRGERNGSVRDSQLWSAARQRRFGSRMKQRAGCKRGGRSCLGSHTNWRAGCSKGQALPWSVHEPKRCFAPHSKTASYARFHRSRSFWSAARQRRFGSRLKQRAGCSKGQALRWSLGEPKRCFAPHSKAASYARFHRSRSFWSAARQRRFGSRTKQRAGCKRRRRSCLGSHTNWRSDQRPLRPRIADPEIARITTVSVNRTSAPWSRILPRLEVSPCTLAYLPS